MRIFLTILTFFILLPSVSQAEEFLLLAKDYRTFAIADTDTLSLTAGPMVSSSDCVAVAFDPNRRLLVAATKNHEVIGVSASSGEIVYKYSDMRFGSITSLALNATGEKLYLLSAELSAVLEMDTETGVVAKTLPVVGPKMSDAKWDMKGLRLVISHGGSRLTHVDLQSWRILREDTFLVPFDDVTPVHQTGEIAGIRQEWNQVVTLDTGTQDELMTIEAGTGPAILSWPVDAPLILVSFVQEQAVAAINPQFASVEWKFSWPSFGVEQLKIIPGTDQALIAGTNKIMSIELGSGQLKKAVQLPFSVASIVFGSN